MQAALQVVGGTKVVARVGQGSVEVKEIDLAGHAGLLGARNL
jgi:hypothetical protein